MAQITTEVTIDRPHNEVFEYISDLRNAEQWNTSLDSRTYAGQIELGTTGLDVFRIGSRRVEAPWVVTEYQPPGSVTIEFSGAFAATARFTFEQSQSGTLMRCVTDLRPTGVWRLLAPIIAREGRRTDEAQFQRVKDILEAGTRVQSPGTARSEP